MLDHPFLNDDRGSVILVTISGKTHRALTKESQSVEGLAWSPDGNEVVFSSEEDNNARAVAAVRLNGKQRLVAASAGPLWLHDVAPDGRALVSREIVRAGIVGIRGNATPVDLSWFDYSVVRDLSADGKTMIYSELSGVRPTEIFRASSAGGAATPLTRLNEGLLGQCVVEAWRPFARSA